MTSIDFLLDRIAGSGQKDAIVWQDVSYSYGTLCNMIRQITECFDKQNMNKGSVVMLKGDFSPRAIALFLALAAHECIIVPITSKADRDVNDYNTIAACEWIIASDSENISFEYTGKRCAHSLVEQLRTCHHPGLILFSSGTTGNKKAIVHDLTRLLKKFEVRRHDLRTLAFLIFDHIGGMDTLFYSLSNTSTLIVPTNHSPAAVCEAIQLHRVEVLPASPSFLNLLLLSEAYRNFDLSSLKYITYGSEVMPAVTLARCREVFPYPVFLQKFGITETGAFRTQSKSSDSLWLKIGGEGVKTRVMDGILQIHTESSMLGYLNAASPFTDDGWFITGDQVEVDGDYIRILGRASEIINVGGQKVYPAEVENVILQLGNIKQAVVYGAPNQILGNIVCAQVSVVEDEDKNLLVNRLKLFCSQRLEPYKVPVKVSVSSEDLVSERFKSRHTCPK